MTSDFMKPGAFVDVILSLLIHYYFFQKIFQRNDLIYAFVIFQLRFKQNPF